MSVQTTRYTCRNPECRWAGKVRVVALIPAGLGLFRRPGPLYCECDFEVAVEELPDLVQP